MLNIENCESGRSVGVGALIGRPAGVWGSGKMGGSSYNKVAKKRDADERKLAQTTADTRAIFLRELSLTANVTAAAGKAGRYTSAFYSKRASDPIFRAQWHAALCEGYARLETELLAEALAPIETGLSEDALKARTAKQRFRLALLAAHRAAVRGERAGAVVARADETKGAKARLGSKIAEMMARVDADVVATDSVGAE